MTVNVLVHATGALSIGTCRVGSEKITQHGRKAKDGTGWEDHWHNELEGGRSWTGRWPANVVVVHRAGCRVVGERRVSTGTAHREKSGGKTIFSDTEKKPLPNMTYGDGDGMETVPDWRCDSSCPAAALGGQSGEIKGTVRKPTGRAIYPTENTAMVWNPNSVADTTVRGIADNGTAVRFFKQVRP